MVIFSYFFVFDFKVTIKLNQLLFTGVLLIKINMDKIKELPDFITRWTQFLMLNIIFGVLLNIFEKRIRSN